VGSGIDNLAIIETATDVRTFSEAEPPDPSPQRRFHGAFRFSGCGGINSHDDTEIRETSGGLFSV